MVRLGPITKEQFDTWLTPPMALGRLSRSWAFSTKAKWIAGRLQSGLIKAAAAAHRGSRDRDAKIEIVEMPSGLWHHWAFLADDEDFWDTGEITIYGGDATGYGGSLVGHFHDVRFEPHSFPAAEASEITRAPSGSGAETDARRSNVGGRPRKDYWEDAIVEMFDRIYHIGFNPLTQAEVEVALAEWIAAKHGDHPSEASIRTRAAKVFKVHKKEG